MPVDVSGLTWRDAWQVHVVETDMQSDGTSHENVVMFSFDSSEGAVLTLFISVELIAGSFVALDPHAFANTFNKCGDDHGLCRGVSMETVLDGEAVNNGIFWS